MAAPLTLIDRTGRRLARQRQVNILGFFLPLAIATAVVCFLLFPVLSIPAMFVTIPVGVIAGFTVFALWRARTVKKRETVATFIDDKIAGQERFLTLATAQDQQDVSFLALVQRQAEKKAAVFLPTRDAPFTLDRRVPWTALGSVLVITLALFLAQQQSIASLPSSAARPQGSVTELEEIARRLINQGTTPQEQTLGAQLLALAEELKNPQLTPQEKLRLIDEAQKRMELNLPPLPKLLPFEPPFASKSQQDNGKGNQSDQPQPDNNPLAKADENIEQLKKSLSAASGNEPQPGPQKDGEQQKPSDSQERGGGIKFDAQQKPGEKKQERSGQEPSGQQQSSSQKETPNSQTPGTDPNRPGGQQKQNQDQSQGQNPNKSTDPQQSGQQEKGKGTTIGNGPGERFLQPGEQGGGFLTKDARFVKVRVPKGEELQKEGEQRTENRGRAVPKTPYSNAPLKEGPPDQATPKQQIPLEYRDILR